MNNKIEQGRNEINIVKITLKKLNKSIDFLKQLC